MRRRYYEDDSDLSDWEDLDLSDLEDFDLSGLEDLLLEDDSDEENQNESESISVDHTEVDEDQEDGFSLMDALDDSDESEKSIAELLDLPAKKYVDVPIDSTKLSYRVNRRIEWLQIKTVGELLQKTPMDLMKVSGFGRNSLVEIDRYVKEIKNNPPLLIESNCADEQDLSNFQAVSGDHFSEKSRQFFLDHFQDVENRDFDELKNACGSDPEILNCLGKLEKSWDKVDLPLWKEYLIKPEALKLLREVLIEYRKKYIAIQEVQGYLDVLPGYKRRNLACYYISIYPGKPDEIDQLKQFYNQDLMTLEDVIRCDDLCEMNRDVLYRFLTWCRFDVYWEVQKIMATMYKSDRDRQIILLRNEGLTLQEIADRFGQITRERIRQIEAKLVRRFGIFQNQNNILQKIAADRNGDMILTIDEISGFCKEYTKEVIYYLKANKNPDYRYSKSMNVFLLESDGTEETRAKNYIEEMPDVFREKDLPGILREAEEEGVPADLLGQFLKNAFTVQDDRYIRSKLSRKQIFENILKTYFPEGIHVSDREEMAQFRQYVEQDYGDQHLPKEDRAIYARISDVGILCGRGRYKCKEEKYISDELAKDIESYITNCGRPILPIRYIFERFEDRLREFHVDNHYYLHGILHVLFDEKFIITRDYVTFSKEITTAQSVLSDAVRRADRPVSIHEMQNIVPGVSAIVISLAMDSPDILGFFGKYYYAGNLQISVEEKNMLRDVLNEMTSEGRICDCSAVYNRLVEKDREFLERNYIVEQYCLFSVLAYIFRDEFQFERPFIAAIDTVIVKLDEQLRNHIRSSGEISMAEVGMFLKETGLQRVISVLGFVKECNTWAFLASKNRMVVIEKTGIDEQLAAEVERIILPYVQNTMAIRDLPCFPELPKVNVEWTDWLVYSVLLKWGKQLEVGETSGQFRSTVPLVALKGQLDLTGVSVETKTQENFSVDDLSNLDELLEDMIDWEDLEE